MFAAYVDLELIFLLKQLLLCIHLLTVSSCDKVWSKQTVGMVQALKSVNKEAEVLRLILMLGTANIIPA